MAARVWWRRPRWDSLWQRLRTSLWFVPVGSVGSAFLLALVLPKVDREWGKDARAWYLYAGQAESAREILSTIASSMLTLAGLVFSITILVLQLASSQFSPRVLRTFLTDRTTQVALGMFLGSFVYPMVLLPQVRSGDHGFVPAFSVFFALALVLVSVLVFVRYIHHMAHSIRTVQVIQRVADETRETLGVLFPDVGEDEPTVPSELPRRAPDLVCMARRPGVLSAIDEGQMLGVAVEFDLLVQLQKTVGDFVAEGEPLLSVWGAKLPDESELHACIVLENERTPTQDAAFGLRQLVDVAERALSPGVNDPTTAVQALDHIHDILRRLTCRKIPSPVRADEHGKRRLLLPRPDYQDYVRLGLDEIRQYGRSSIQVVRRVRALLEDLLRVAPPARRPPLLEQLRLLELGLPHDFEDLAERRLAATPSAQGHGASSLERPNGASEPR